MAELASSYISAGDIPSTVQTLLMTGAAIGAIAGVIRTAVDRLWGAQKDTLTKAVIDIATGFTATPIPNIGKCVFFPMASALWKDLPIAAHLLTCAAFGGFTATVLAPVGITASTAARLANQYFG